MTTPDTESQQDVDLADDLLDDQFDPIDEEFAPRARQKLGRLTGALAAVLAIGIGFLAGAYVQKNHGSSSAATAGRANFAARAGAGGAGLGGFGGAGATGAGQGGFGGQAGGQAGNQSTTTATSAIPVVIGTVVSVRGLTVVVKNLGGTSVTVHMTASTTITTKARANGLKADQTVAVFGTPGVDAIVTATSVTVQ